ncbi:hypothetical protein NGM99_11800 [Mesorhizobium sp. RP14(2022)]|uniref:Uncharacterized protein n=1 Tax=Mesorhizobium liriopis TaxID=2953882 RepID=A0ABT1C8F3_9HYPH|nr:hypothetical protein [Mesorhizobium liriopis]MCO6050465.1 hypothetical protein [Mesorhizobium liriopis]
MLQPTIPHDAAEWKRSITNFACHNPKVNGWAIDNVMTVVTKQFADMTSPEVMVYFNKRG